MCPSLFGIIGQTKARITVAGPPTEMFDSGAAATTHVPPVSTVGVSCRVALLGGEGFNRMLARLWFEDTARTCSTVVVEDALRTKCICVNVKVCLASKSVGTPPASALTDKHIFVPRRETFSQTKKHLYQAKYTFGEQGHT